MIKFSDETIRQAQDAFYAAQIAPDGIRFCAAATVFEAEANRQVEERGRNSDIGKPSFEPGKTYRTRSGQEALIYCVDAPGETPIHGRVGQDMFRWNKLGIATSLYGHPYDLLPPGPERISRKVWVNVYPDNIASHFTKDTASGVVSPNAIRIAVPCWLEEIEK